MAESLVNKVFKNTIALVIGRVLVLLLSMFGSIMLVRYLGRENFGKYSVVYAYLSFFTVFSTLAFEQIIIRMLSQSKEPPDEIIGKFTGSTLFFSLLAIAIMFSGSYLVRYSNEIKIYILIASLELLATPLMVINFLYQANIKIWIISVLITLQQLLYTAFIFVLVYLESSLVSFFIFKVISVLIIGFISRMIARGLIKHRIEFNLAWTLDILKQSWPLVITVFSIAIYTRIDQVLIYKLMDEQSVGDYAAAVKVAELFNIIPSTFLAVVYPVFCKFFSDSKEYYNRLISISYKYLFILIIPSSLLIFLFSSLIIDILFTKTFLLSSGVLKILIWSEVAVFFGNVITNILISSSLQKYLMFSTLFGALLNIVLNLILIPFFGITGSAWATVISYSFSSVFFYLLFSKTRPIALTGLKILFKITLPIIPTIVIYLYMALQPIYLMVFFLLIFSLWLVFSKQITSEDIILIKKSIHVRRNEDRIY